MLLLINPASLFDEEVMYKAKLRELRRQLPSDCNYYVLDTDDLIVEKVSYTQLYQFVSDGIDIFNVALSTEFGLRLRAGSSICYPFNTVFGHFYNKKIRKIGGLTQTTLKFESYEHDIQFYACRNMKKYTRVWDFTEDIYVHKILVSGVTLCALHEVAGYGASNIDDIYEAGFLYFFKFENYVVGKFGVLLPRYNTVMKLNLFFTECGELVDAVPEPYESNQGRIMWKSYIFDENKSRERAGARYRFGRCIFGSKNKIIRY